MCKCREFLDSFTFECDWKDLSLMGVCAASLGALAGMVVPEKYKKAAEEGNQEAAKQYEAIMKFMEVEQPSYQSSFSVGEAVKITEGAFADFIGSIQEIDNSKGKVKVLISFLGREAPVELDFSQVIKL